MAKSEPKPVEGLSFEAAYAELEKIAAALESGEKTLDDSMLLFERGQALVKHCASLLDKAELKVQTLSGEELEEFKADE